MSRPRAIFLFAMLIILSLSGCNRPSHNYKHSATYDRIVEDNDAAYIPPEHYRPKIRIYPQDNDNSYIPPRGRLARVPRPYPRDNDESYTYPHGYEPKDMNGNGHNYPRDNDAAYTYPSDFEDGNNSMIDIYPLYMD